MAVARGRRWLDGPVTAVARWAHLAGSAFRLDELMRPSPADVVRELDNVLEVFDDSVDPADDFEGAAVRRFAVSVRRVLERAKPSAR